MLSLACFCFLFGDPVFAQQQAPQKAVGGTLTIISRRRRSRGPVIWTG